VLSQQKSPVEALRMAQLASIVASRHDGRAFATWTAFVAIGGGAAHGT
jgi:hypothetical protein